MSSRDITDIVDQMQQMMSHGIFDAEVIAGNFRSKGWKFVMDPDLDDPELTGGKYLVRTPEGREGHVTWFTKDRVEELIGNAGFFMEGKAPRALLLAWIFANELGFIIFGIDASEQGALPGELFRRVYEWMENTKDGPRTESSDLAEDR